MITSEEPAKEAGYQYFDDRFLFYHTGKYMFVSIAFHHHACCHTDP